MGITHCFTSVSHPQANGKTEVANRKVETEEVAQLSKGIVNEQIIPYSLGL